MDKKFVGLIAVALSVLLVAGSILALNTTNTVEETVEDLDFEEMTDEEINQWAEDENKIVLRYQNNDFGESYIYKLWGYSDPLEPTESTVFEVYEGDVDEDGEYTTSVSYNAYVDEFRVVCAVDSWYWDQHGETEDLVEVEVWIDRPDGSTELYVGPTDWTDEWITPEDSPSDYTAEKDSDFAFDESGMWEIQISFRLVDPS